MRTLRSVPAIGWAALAMVALSLWVDDVRGIYIAGVLVIVAIVGVATRSDDDPYDDRGDSG